MESCFALLQKNVEWPWVWFRFLIGAKESAAWQALLVVAAGR